LQRILLSEIATLHPQVCGAADFRYVCSCFVLASVGPFGKRNHKDGLPARRNLLIYPRSSQATRAEARNEWKDVQKFEPGNVFPFSSPSRGLEAALSRAKPVLYVRLSNDPFEDLI
jgi:hypothetical protein